MWDPRSGSPRADRIDARRSLTFVFDDERWVKKILIGALFALGPVLVVGIFFLVGYLVEIVRRVAADSDDPLPEWAGNYRTYFTQGFPAACGVLIWLIPFQLVWIGAALLMGSPQSIPVQLALGIVMLVTANLYAALVVPSVIGLYAATGRFGSMFRFGEIFRSIRRIGTGFVAVWIVHLVVLALTFVSIWAIVAIMFTTAYAAMVFGHVYGQAMRIGIRTPAAEIDPFSEQGRAAA